MTQQVMHQPRVAWDFARTLVSAAEADEVVYAPFSVRVGELLGSQWRQELSDTRTRLERAARVDTHQVEVGLWRVRMEDLLRAKSALAGELQRLRQDTASVLAGR